MEPQSKQSGDMDVNDDDCFLDAQDDFSFHDCHDSDQSVPSTSASTLTDASPAVTSPASALRRPSGVSGTGPEDSNQESSSAESRGSQIHGSGRGYGDTICELDPDLRENNKNLAGNEAAESIQDREAGGLTNGHEEESTVTTSKDGGVGVSVDTAGVRDDSSLRNLLVLLSGLVIKAIWFQINLFVSFCTFPIRLLYCCYMLVVDPFGAVRRSRRFVMQKLVSSSWKLISASFSSLAGAWLKEHKIFCELLLPVKWGLFWFFYVGIVVCGLLAVAAMLSVLFMRFLVEEPMKLREELNFDYTKPSPVAFVPIMFGDVGCGASGKDGIIKARNLGSRAIPRNHKLQVRILMTLPESDYNRNLGNFQVRVDFMLADGKVIASKSHPSMLRFRSNPIRFMSTLLEILPLVAGYLSESQNLELKIGGFTERDMPTSCLSVTIEQRVEFQPGGGIPEIYDASLVLESELHFLKKIIWSWKRVLVIGITIATFMTEMLITLVCCGPLLVWRLRPRDGSAINNVPRQR